MTPAAQIASLVFTVSLTRLHICSGEARRYVEVYQAFPYNADGEIKQLRNAQQAVNKGSLALAIACTDGAVVAGQLRPSSPLALPASKIGRIDSHIAYIMCGIVPDGRYLVKKARLLSQRHWFEYDEEIGVPALLMDLCKVITSAHYRAVSKPDKEDEDKDFIQQIRPTPTLNPFADKDAEVRREGSPARHFGIGLLVCGPDPAGGWAVYEIGPAGMFLRWEARAMGEGKEVAEEILEEKWHKGMSVEDACRLAVGVLDHMTDGNGSVEIAVIRRQPDGEVRLQRVEEAEVVRWRSSRASGDTRLMRTGKQ